MKIFEKLSRYFRERREERETVFLPVAALTDSKIQVGQPATAGEMEALTQSIRAGGIQRPLLVRSLENGQFEILDGHRRKAAASAVGYAKVPCIIRKLDDSEAVATICAVNLCYRNHEEEKK